MVDLIYVDEQPDERNKVVRRAVQSGEFSHEQVRAIAPKQSLVETIDVVVEFRPRVLITDFRLSEHSPYIEFSGTDLVRAFREKYAEFPCFVTTSFAGEAADQDIDTNLVFPKGDFLDRRLQEQGGLPFFKRVKSKINRYERSIADAEFELEALVYRQRTERLNSHEVERLIELDSFVESTIRNDQRLPKNLKHAALKPFNDVTRRLDAILNELEVNLGIGGNEDE